MTASPSTITWRLAELAERIGGDLSGNGDVVIHGVSTLQNGAPGMISFLANSRYRTHLYATRASAVILKPEDAEDCPVDAILMDNPYAGFARITRLFDPSADTIAGVSPSAVVSPDAQLGGDVYIGPGAVVEAGAVLGDRVSVGPHCVVGPGVVVGEDGCLVAHVTLCHSVVLGPRCLMHPGVVIGADGFGFAQDGERWEKISQLGSVRIGADVEIGANTVVDRGAIDDTVLEDGVKLDALIQIGHNVVIGEHTAMAGCSGVAGSTKIGRRCAIYPRAAILGHLELADDVRITACSMVTKSILQAGTYSSGVPAEPNHDWRRNQARFHQLDRMARRLAKLEAKLKDHD